MKIRVASNEQLSKPYAYELGQKLKSVEIEFGPNAFADYESDGVAVELKIDSDLHSSIMKKGLYKFNPSGQVQSHLQKQVALMSKSGKTAHVIYCNNKEEFNLKDFQILVNWSYQFGFYAHYCDSIESAVKKAIVLCTKGMKKMSGLITSV